MFKKELARSTNKLQQLQKQQLQKKSNFLLEEKN